MKCPICGQKEYMITQLQYGVPVTVEAPLIQFSYKGSKDYVPPRCGKCFDRMMERRDRGYQEKRQSGVEVNIKKGRHELGRR